MAVYLNHFIELYLTKGDTMNRYLVTAHIPKIGSITFSLDDPVNLSNGINQQITHWFGEVPYTTEYILLYLKVN
jgi:hypothetical protein